MNWLVRQVSEHPILCAIIVPFFLFVMDGLIGALWVRCAHRRK